MYPIHLKYDAYVLEREFDSRTSHAGKWSGRISGIRDQGWCASSWAFSTVAGAADRLAIQSKGSQVQDLSPQNLLSCNNRHQKACSRGYVDIAWNYIKKFG